MSDDPNRTTEHYIDPAQLCIGLHVHLDLTWMEHPFTFSSFKIKSLEQIATIQSLGLKQVRYSPTKSDGEPLAAPDAKNPAAVQANAAEMASAFQAKRERLERLASQRARVNSCERDLVSAGRTIKSINQNLFSRPEQARREASELVDKIAQSMLVESDIAIHLMADKVNGEEIYYHSLNVTMLSMMLGKEMKAPPQGIRLLGMGAMFHDIGKIDIPDRVTKKMEPLTKAEVGVLQQHCAGGIEIGRKLGLPNEVLLMIAQHHEHIDGSGYPKRLKEPQISLLSKILAVVNAYDNLCNPVNLANALTPHEALSTLYGQQRNRFDNLSLTTFVRCLGVYPPGTIVALSNGALGMVVGVNSSRPLKPTVMVYDPAVPKEAAIVVDLEKEPDVTVSKTLRPQTLPTAAHDYLAPRKRTTYYFDAELGKKAA